MEFQQVVTSRRMVRAFDPGRAIPEELVERALANATRAPSAGFSQGWDFVVLQGHQTDLFWRSTTSPQAKADRWLRGVSCAPVLIICCADKQRYLDRYAEPDKGWTDRDERNWPIPYWDTDVAMAALLILLTAVDAGLGALFFGVPAPRHRHLRDVLGIPPDRRLVGVVALGYAVAHPPSPSVRRGRRRATEVIHRGRW